MFMANIPLVPSFAVTQQGVKPRADIPASEPQSGSSRAWRFPPRQITKPAGFVIATTDACRKVLNH